MADEVRELTQEEKIKELWVANCRLRQLITKLERGVNPEIIQDHNQQIIKLIDDMIEHLNPYSSTSSVLEATLTELKQSIEAMK